MAVTLDSATIRKRLYYWQSCSSTYPTTYALLYLILVSMFRQSPRSAGPPSAFPNGLHPVASNDVNGSQQRRISRTDMNFEQALHSQDTVLIREGVDVNTLGAGAEASFTSSPYASPSPSQHPPRLPQIGAQPATPTIVPPTPSPNGAGPSSSAKRYPSTPSTTTPNDSFYHADDHDYQTKRRSMYRSPGSASSPDLATLMRKKKRPEPLIKQDSLVLDSSGARLRTTSGTPSSNSSSSNKGKYKTERFVGTPNSRQPEWNMTSPLGIQDEESAKARGCLVFSSCWLELSLCRKLRNLL